MSFSLPSFQDLPRYLQLSLAPKLEELKVLGAKPEKSAGEELAMEKLGLEIQNLVRAHVRKAFQPATMAAPKVGLQEMKILGFEHVEAEAKMFFSPWSEEFVHGPDTILPVTHLAQQLLKPRETLEELERISWRQPITCDLNLVVEENPQLEALEKPVVLDGAFVTSAGRSLNFYATETGNVVDLLVSYNQLAQQILGNAAQVTLTEKRTSAPFEQAFQLPDFDLVQDFHNSVPFRLATVAEIMSLGLANILRHKKIGAVLAGINDLRIPQPNDNFFQEENRLGIRLLNDRQKKSSSGFQLLPFEAFLPHQKEPATGLLAYTFSADLAQKLG